MCGSEEVEGTMEGEYRRGREVGWGAPKTVCLLLTEVRKQ